MSAPVDETVLDPTWQEIITVAIERALMEAHTGLPASVVSFDPTNSTADVQPLLQRAFVDEAGETSIVTSPQVTRVPVVFPRFGPWSIASKLRPGETVFLSFAERSIDAWLDSAPGTLVDPQDVRHHSLSDAIAIPGLRTRTEAQASIVPIDDDLRIAHENGLVEVRLTAGEAHVKAPQLSFAAGGDADQSFVRGDALADYLRSKLTVPTAFGPSGPSSVPLVPGVELSTTIKGR